MAGRSLPTRLEAPPQEELTELARKWVAVERSADEEYGLSLTTDPDSLALLQRLLDDDDVDRRAYDLQCLGCVLGRVMAEHIPGLDWALATDELGSEGVFATGGPASVCSH